MMIRKSTLRKVKNLEDFVWWIAKIVIDEEDWETNSLAYDELICRRLVKCGVLTSENNHYHVNKRYHSPTVELIGDKRRDTYKSKFPKSREVRDEF